MRYLSFKQQQSFGSEENELVENIENNLNFAVYLLTTVLWN